MTATLPALAGTADLEDWLGETLDVGDVNRAEALLGAASALVRSETAQTWLDANGDLDTVPADVAAVVVQCAARVWRNPAGVVHETAGPFSARYAEAVAEGLYLTATERAILDRHKPSTSGLWTMATTRQDVETGTTYVDDDAGVPIPVIGREPY